MDYVNLIDTLSLWLYPSPLPYYPTPQPKENYGWNTMENDNKRNTCMHKRTKDGFYAHGIPRQSTGCKAVINESTIHTYYIQLTQPTNGGNMSKFTISKVTITTRKGKGTHVRTLSPTEIKKDTKINTFHYEGKDER